MAHLPRVRKASLLCLPLLALLPACAQRVWMMVPPRFDLGGYDRIGLVELRCTDPLLRRQATHLFQEMVLDARPGSQLVLLPASVLAGPAQSGAELDLAAIRALGEQHGFRAVFVGSIEVSKPTPRIGIATSLVELDASADVLGTLDVRLIEPSGGATIWASSAQEQATVASGGIDSEGQGSFGITDPQAVRSALVRTLASQVTQDFRAQYFRKRLEDIPPGYRVTYPDGEEVYVPPGVEG